MRTYKDPKALAKRLTVLALRRLELEDEVKRIRHEETQLAEQGALLFRQRDVSQEHVVGAGKVTLSKQPIVNIEDWDACLAWAAAHPKYGIVHKRVSATAVEKLAFEEIAVPGVVLDHKFVLSVNVREGRKVR